MFYLVIVEQSSQSSYFFSFGFLLAGNNISQDGGQLLSIPVLFLSH